MYAIPNLYGNHSYVEREIVELAWYPLVGFALPSIVMLWRDVNRRKHIDKNVWKGLLIWLPFIGMPLYFYKHARHPMPKYQ